VTATISSASKSRTPFLMQSRKDVKARCEHCGHPRREHYESTCSVPKCVCAGYLLVDHELRSPKVKES
jgi:hypothetical protein